MACVEIKMARSSKIHKEKTPQHKREGKKNGPLLSAFNEINSRVNKLINTRPSYLQQH